MSKENLKVVAPAVDPKIQLKKKINAKISKKLNPDPMPQPYITFLSSLGGVAFLPFILIAAILAGIKVGFMETMRVGLKLCKWGI